MNAEDKLHWAICNAVILLNNGEEIAPRVSSILRTALAEYEPTPKATTAAGLVDDAMVERAVAEIGDFQFCPKLTERKAAMRAALEAAIGREVGE